MPPDTVTDVVPLHMQLELVVEGRKDIEGLLLIVAVEDFLQPLESVVVSEYVPAQSAAIAVVVFPLDHE